MGNTSGGDPGPSRTNNLKNLLQSTREKHQIINPGDKRWPCAFCFNKYPTFMKCRTHIIDEHGFSSEHLSQSNAENSKMFEIESQDDFRDDSLVQGKASKTDDLLHASVRQRLPRDCKQPKTGCCISKKKFSEVNETKIIEIESQDDFRVASMIEGNASKTDDLLHTSVRQRLPRDCKQPKTGFCGKQSKNIESQDDLREPMTGQSQSRKNDQRNEDHEINTCEITNDLTTFLKLVERDYPSFNDLSENATCKQSKNSDEDEEMPMHFGNMMYGDEDDYFCCPYCEKVKRFHSLRGLNIHIVKKHPDKNKLKLDDFEDNDCDLNAFGDSDVGQRLAFLKKSVPTLRRCPKGARQDMASALTNAINQCIRTSSEYSWNKLLLFPYATMKIPNKDENVTNLTSYVRQNIREWNEKGIQIIPDLAQLSTTSENNFKTNNISKKVEAKLSDGDISGALRLISSEDIIAPNNEITLDALKQKHPQHPEPSFFPDSSIDTEQVIPTDEEVNRSIVSFRKGTAGGLDSLRPQILKDLLYVQNGDTANKLLQAITSLITQVFNGKIPNEIRPYLFGASLTALQKKTGGIRPIAVGNTWRRITAKIACRRVASVLTNLYLPHQLGVGIKNGAEAGAHAARIYFTSKHKSVRVFLKIDVRNAFNELRRDILLQKVKSTIPEIYKFVELCYRDPTNVYYREHVILSQRGEQQGDPLGPALFSLVLQDIVMSLQNLDLNIWYLDDGTIGGAPDDVFNALQDIIQKARDIGLELNYEKCEISVLGTESDECKNEIYGRFNSISNGIQKMSAKNEFLLGSPLTEAASTLCLENKTKDLMNLTEKLKQISSHSAYCLLRFSITTPRLIFFLRGSPMWQNCSGLQHYDEVLKNSLESLFNLHLTDKAWIESSLPIKKGGIGLRHASDIALPCFLSSMYNVSTLLNQLLHETYRQDDLVQVEAEEQWCQRFGELPEESLRPLQSAWENFEITRKLEVIHSWPNDKIDKARLLANSSEESGAWLQALPSPQLGTHLNNDEFRVAIALRLGLPIVQPHKCVCGSKVDKYGRHGLSCSKASGTQPRHRNFNNLMQRGLKSAEVPCLLEPPGCSRPDGKKPDGLSLLPWTKGKSLLWDYTCADTFASSYINRTSKELGWAAKLAEEKKYEHYVDLREQFIFIPVATETSGVFGKEAIKLIKAIGSKIAEVTHEKRATSFLFQRLALSIQRGNVASILGTIPPSKNLAELFYL